MFDVKKIKTECVEWIRGYFAENGPDCNAVVGISGGKDSSVVAALCVEALGVDRVIGVLMPNGEQADISASYMLVNHLGIRYHVVNIQEAYNGVLNAIGDQFPIDGATTLSLPARLRMVTVYAVAQSNNGRVANTCNLSEDWVGYATRYGDGAGDFSPLSRLTVQEVKALGRELGLPEALVEKVPIDGRGQSRLHLRRARPLYPHGRDRRSGHEGEDRPHARAEPLQAAHDARVRAGNLTSCRI